MGYNVPFETNRRTLLVWWPTSCHGRHLLKEGGNFIISWLANSRTPGNLQHYVGNLAGFLVAIHEEGHYWIRKRMYQMSSKEKPTKPTQTLPVSHSIRYVLYPFHIYSHGLHCQTPCLWFVWYNTYNYGHLFQSLYFHPMQWNHKCRTNS